MEVALPSRARILGNGFQRLNIRPRQFQGVSEAFYLVFAFSLHKHLLVNILLHLTDDSTGFTVDIVQRGFSSSLMLRNCTTFRQVDIPSVASLDDSE